MTASPRQRPGSRGRIGVIQPAPGVMIEHEWPNYLPNNVLFPVARVRLTSADKSGYDEVAREAVKQAPLLASARCGVIAYACAIGSLYAGANAESRLLDALSEASGLSAISLAQSSLMALRSLGASRPAVLTPYDPPTNRLVTDYLMARECRLPGSV